MSQAIVDTASALDPSLLSFVHAKSEGSQWWRSAVIYQIYPKSFRDLNGDGFGDLAGITAELHSLSSLGVDAVWLSPFYPSPQRDGGYDVSDYCNVDPLFGNLADFDALIDRANHLGLRVIVDLVPNHCSDEHPLFQAALQAPAGSPERDLFVFRDGRGPAGDEPPNNWQSHFGGPAWTRITESDGRPGQWYLHLFDSSQPDFNWDSESVRTEFERVLRFWLDRGVSGFRVDVAHALVKASGLPDWGGRADGGSSEGFPGHEAPMFGQPEIHNIFRRWRDVLAEYDGERILCAEASIDPLPRLANWVREDQMHQAFNFAYLHCPYDAGALRHVIDSSLRAFDEVGAPTTWVLSNHDVVRHASRLGLPFGAPRSGDGVGPRDEQPDSDLGRRRARASSLFMLGLPGGAYLYQGEELGLPDHTALADEHRQDPTFHRTAGERVGRDGCRVPLPWRSGKSAAGFSCSGGSWLPQPEEWHELARDRQEEDPGSHLQMYKAGLALRRDLGLGAGSLSWVVGDQFPNCLAFVNGNVLVIMNLGQEPVVLPDGVLLLNSGTGTAGGRELGPDQTAWLELA